MATEYFYGGKPYSLTPVYNNPITYGSQASSFGTSVDARTANQVKEVSEHLNSGIKIVEVGGHDPSVFDSIPKDHLKELNRLAKLAKAELTFHGPMIDPSGISQHGWDKMSQKAAEAQLWNSIERSHDLNPDGNVNVTLHASTASLPGAEVMVKEKSDEKPRTISMLYINESSGQIGQLKEEEKYFGGEKGKPVPFNPEKELEDKNKDAWMQTMTNVNFASQRGEQDIHQAIAIMKNEPLARQSMEEIEQIKDHPEIYSNALEVKKAVDSGIEHGKMYLMEAYRNTKALYNDVYKNAKPEEQEKLRKYAEEVIPMVEKFNELQEPEELNKFAEVIQQGVKTLRELKPQIFKPIKQFAVEKTADTISNLALKSYNQFHDTAPVISVENHPAFQSLLTTGEELRDVVLKSREEFIKKATSGGMSESDAKAQAEKLIGATWDVGHINMLRRYGYTNKELIEQTEKIAPLVKKVHLSDNFGYEHTELPMGMGNVPIKEMMDKLKKGDEAFKGPKIIEALQWWQHFSPGGKINPPFVPTLQAFGASMYAGGPGWNEPAGVPGGYFSGYGNILPEQHFAMYGAGFSSLPVELGGQVPSKDSRFSGTPMA